MDKFTDQLAGRLSSGMKQSALLRLDRRTANLLPDEPTTGVDPVSRREFWDTLAELSAQGDDDGCRHAVLDEAERCSRVC